ncbi:DUF6493 family protein [Actinoplanes palleronii]|uniref:Secreted protein n=1 Tax=Actinoplanes palleronii TaxID=113570 RepID=A0ABQ4BEL9_9ACTN|nr:DUF6493 family protein [Actinoplanes palleronii]GIE68786.1 hypothetical protein Apa02nite_048940 [Actinoplanes palleronii]
MTMTTPLTWVGLDRRAHRNEVGAITALLLAATEEERLALAEDVEAGIKKADRDGWWRGDTSPTPGHALAVIGCMPTAAKAAALLLRGNMRNWSAVTPRLFLEIAQARELPWLGELGQRLAARTPVRERWNNDWPFAVRLMHAGGAEPPVTEGVTRAWVEGLLRPAQQGTPVPPLSIRMRDDPFLPVLLPAVFAFDGLGADLLSDSWQESGPQFPPVVAHLVAEGTLERKTVLDLTVDRLVRGDKPHCLRPFTLLHEALAPGIDEMSSHALDYARLLAEAPGAVAAVAQKVLRAVDDAGRLELDTLLDTSAATLVRTEKTLVKAQITWLEKVSRREPGRAAEVLETVAVAFGHPALDVQDRALTVIGKRIGDLDPAVVARLADAAVALSGDLPARAAALFGTVVEEGPAEIPELPPPAPPAAMPAPIATPAELAEEVAALVHEPAAIRWERVLAGLVTLNTTAGPAALATALQPVLDRYPGDFEENTWNRSKPLLHLGVAIRSAIGTDKPGGLWLWLVTSLRTAWQDGRRGGVDSAIVPTPDGVLALRVAETVTQLTSTMVPLLMATPTHVTGSLDAAVLLDRLRRAESEGWQPWPVDFEQALLRLPRVTDPVVAAGAATLTSPAGRQFAAWLADGGLPDPVSTRFQQEPARRGYTWYSPVGRRVVAALTPARGGGLRLERQLLTIAPGPHPEEFPSAFHDAGDVLAMVLPHHREVTAAWALPELAAMTDQEQREGAAVLPLLAECSGPVGPALAYAVAYALTARYQESRIAAVDAFLTLAAGPPPARAAGPARAAEAALPGGAAPFAGAVGAAVADLGADATLKLSRLVPALAEAYRAGAAVAVWEVLATALPAMLASPQRGLPDLLELASQVAGAVHARVEIPGLAEVASRPGSSRLVKEAKRLQTVLTP